MTFASVADRDAIEAEMPWAARDVPATLYAQLQRTAAAFPDHPAVSFQLFSGPGDTAETLSWRVLKDKTTQAANLFRSLGVGETDVIAYVLPNCNETVFTLLGGAVAGIVTPINPLLEPEQIAAILRETGLNIRGVDFDLDNPAPEGFSSDTLIEDYGPARINLIHLNAESTPLAYAYQPDVFSGRYNIGYFFWELDQPAYCHYLGMEMLDEIWVSTEYGVQIYQPDSKGKPVVNVGMCYEEIDDISREEARAYVKRRFRFDDSHFVCLVAFDSFSFVQRKNPVSVLRAFQKAFEGVPNARLVVKTQNRDSVFDPVQVQLWDRVDSIIVNDPRIVVMNETLSYRNLLKLKAGSDCYVSLHKSEGWGFGMIEAMALKVPVICTAYSGNMDFCSDETAWLVDYEEVPLKHGDYIFVRPESKWAEPSVEDAARQMRAAYDDPAARLAKADAAYAFIRENFSAKAIAKRYGGRLREILADLDKQGA